MLKCLNDKIGKNMDNIIIWSLIGMALMAIEIFGIQGIGILFTGFSAITVVFMIYLDPTLADDVGTQLFYFFLFTALWAAILWIPLNKFIRYSDNGDYSNIINTYATTNKDMIKGQIGEVVWSGTKVRAMIDGNNTEDIINDKTTVRITSVIDGLFYITSDIRKDTADNLIKK